MNFQVKSFLGSFNFNSYQAALTASRMTGGTVHRILGKRNKQFVLGSAI